MPRDFFIAVSSIFWGILAENGQTYPSKMTILPVQNFDRCIVIWLARLAKVSVMNRII